MQVSQQSTQLPQVPNIVPELKITPIFNNESSNDIYRVEVGEAFYIAKVFPPNQLPCHEREKIILTQLSHPHIIKPVDFSHALVSKIASSVLNPFILFPEHTKGDLLTYVYANGILSQRVTRYYAQQLVEALSYAQESLILHPRLHPENILLDENRNAVLCGWSNSLHLPNQILKNLLFEVGEVIMSLLTSRMPFISKDSKNDPFAKFLNEKYIHKLWEQIEKAVKKLSKDFQFSRELKELLEGLFLGKIDAFKGILESNWLKEPVRKEDVEEQLKNQENKALQSKQAKKIKAINAQKQEKELIKNNFALSLSRKPSRSSDIFQEEYENFQNSFSTIEVRSKSDCRQYFKIFDSDIRFIVSHLRAKLKQAEREEEILVDQLLLLKDFDVSMNNSGLKVNFTFGWNYEELEETSTLSGFNHSIDVVLRREEDQLLGSLELSEALELNPTCVYRLNHWVMEAIQHYG